MVANNRQQRKISKKWLALLASLPGYDPFQDSVGCWFDEKLAQRHVDFFHECLTHIEGDIAGQSFILEPWEQAFIGCLFGWLRVDDRGRTVRRYREALLYIPRKNGKTPLSAGICCDVLFTDHEPGAQIYCAAAKRDQATYVYRHAAGMVRNEPELASRAKIFKGIGQRSISYEEENSSLKVISADAGTEHGQNSHLVVIDELHAQPNGDLVDVLQTSLASVVRKQPLLIHITTADYMRDSVCNDKYSYACRVRDGIFDDKAFLPVIYEASLKDDWTDEAVWEKANPNIDVSVSREYLRRECARAIEMPKHENTFKRLHLNIRTEQDVRWLPMDKWDACAGESVCLEDYRGRACYAGLDLATVRDMTALVIAFPEEDSTFTLLPIFWIPREHARARERKDKVPYGQWIREGWVRTTEGNRTDYATVRRDINNLVAEDRLGIKKLAIDRLFQGEQLTHELLEQDGFDVVPFGQGFYSMASPTARFEDLVVEGKLRHGGNPVLRWHASNATVRIDDAGNMKPSREKSAEKIDGIVAAIMAIGMTALAEVEEPSVYNERGFACV